jgi:hypothetical protein
MAPVAIKGEHLQRPHAFLERLAARQRLQLADYLGVAAQLDIALHPRELRGDTPLRQPRRLRRQRGTQRDALERLAAPDSERLLESRARSGRLAAAARLVSRVSERLEPT